MQQRRRWHTWLIGGPLAILFIFIFAFLALGNLGLMKTVKWSNQEKQLEGVIEEVNYTSRKLRHARLGTAQYEAFLTAGKTEIAQLLQIAKDAQLPPELRLDAIMRLAELVNESTPLSSIAAEHRAELVDILTPFTEQLGGKSHALAVAALHLLASTKALPSTEASEHDSSDGGSLSH